MAHDDDFVALCLYAILSSLPAVRVNPTMDAHSHRIIWLITASLFGLSGISSRALGDDTPASRFHAVVEAVLSDHCYSCHGDGAKKGGVTLDAFTDDKTLLANRDLWFNVLKNVRAGVMPPADKPRPSAEEILALENWIKHSALGIDPKDPDPGRVTIRRMNRVEYRNTIKDLMGIDFKTEEEFPPDDTGYGFDTIGDVLSVSPLLLEKYMQAAETIVANAVPTVSRVLAVETIRGADFRMSDGAEITEKLTFYKPAKIAYTMKDQPAGWRHLIVNLSVHGAFDFDPGRCRLTFRSDDEALLREEFVWQDRKIIKFEFNENWKAGDHRLSFEMEPLTPIEKKKTAVDMKIESVLVEGPMDKAHWTHPKNFDRFFSEDDSGTPEGRRRYTRESLKRFATRAFRRPVDERTLDRLGALAEGVYSRPGASVEEGMAKAMVAVLSSPRFLFRVEAAAPRTAGQIHPYVDEYALASRLSYFLWSTMPDDVLFGLAEQGALRKDLKNQVKRMLDDPRSEMLFKNFTGQWLQARDVDGIAVDAKEVLARDNGEEKLLHQEMEAFKAFLAQREVEAKAAKVKGEPEKKQQPGGFRRGGQFPRLFGQPKADLDDPLRQAMRRETEMFFAAIVKEDRSALELLDSDFTFLNARLAKHYGIPDVKGEAMRRVTLPKDSPRGGILTQGTMLVVTSNPTRTSPVKRGLFVLDNILGTPSPPPPPDIPQLEEAEKAFTGREPTLREVMEVHRSKPLCNACHSRMDPLGLALENFNAMGMWREKERGQALDTGGKLITGESFDGIQALKKVLKEKHRDDFYRCLTEKLLTYAVGRGMESSDVESIDQVVQRLNQEEGRMSALILGVIESPPFQKRRNPISSAEVPAGPSLQKSRTGETP